MSRKATPPTPELIERVHREVAATGFLSSLTAWADRQCGRMLSIEDRTEPGKATDLVNAAVVATLDGVRRWDPEARTFRRHCEQTINSLLWNEIDKWRRRRFIALDTTSVDDSQDEAPPIDYEMSIRSEDMRKRPDGLFAQREVRAEVFHALRSRTRPDDVTLRAFLDCFEAGHNRTGEVCARLGLTASSHRAVLARFHLLRSRLPEDLRHNLAEVMFQDGGPPIATVARRARRVPEILSHDRTGEPANESSGTHDALGWSSDGGDSGDGDGEREAA